MPLIRVDQDALSELLDVAADLASVTNLIAEHGGIPSTKDVGQLTWRLIKAMRAVTHPREPVEPTVLDALYEIVEHGVPDNPPRGREPEDTYLRAALREVAEHWVEDNTPRGRGAE